MSASAHRSGNHRQEQSSINGGTVAFTSFGNSGQGNENSGTASAMKHNPGIATDWTAEEQSILENGLTQHASVPSIIRYAKIAMQLPNKTVRDVALRARWMNRKETSKRRKDDNARKSKDKREKVIESLHTSKPGGHPSPLPAISLEEEDDISCKSIGGPTGELLAQNQQLFQQISSNFDSGQIQDNISFFCQARDNLYKIMNNVHDTPEIMKQMPPLPVKLNEEFARIILPTTNHQKPL